MKKIINQILSLTPEDFFTHDTLSTTVNYINNKSDVDLYTKPAGIEHYRLLSVISNLFEDNTLYDVGSYKGLSALALSSNKHNYVKSYDIRWCIEVERPDNVEFVVGDFTMDFDPSKTKFIFVDVDPHDGNQERRIIEFLYDMQYKGLIMFDDIHQFEGMRNFWKNVYLPKYDLTHLGHWSGSGLVDFSDIVY